MKLHEKIYYYRKKAGLSQDALAEKLGRFEAGYLEVGDGRVRTMRPASSPRWPRRWA